MNALTTAEIAHLTGLTRQAVAIAIKRAMHGTKPSWAIYLPPISVHTAQGGNDGKQYLVPLEALTPQLQERYKALNGSSKAVLSEQAAAEMNWRFEQIKPLIQSAPRSKERRAAFDALVNKTVFDWQGRKTVLKKLTLYGWLQKYEEMGIQGLARSGRNDKGQTRTIISRKWDKAVALSDDVKWNIAVELETYIGGAIKAGAKLDRVRMLASRKLETLTKSQGIAIPNLKQVCKLHHNHRLLRTQKYLKKVARHKMDRKASEDNRPRAVRSKRGMRPMEMVVMDVHHTNVLLHKVVDGKKRTGTAKLLSIKDEGTDRVWCDLIFFEDKGGVRNSDVMLSFAGMCAHPAFGVPEAVYCDNGTEYNFADFCKDAFTLSAKMADNPVFSDRKTVMRAEAYNPQTKPIEAWFGQFEQQFLKHIPGYIGDDRMNQKSPHKGKPPAPFGSFEEFRAIFFKNLWSYEASPRYGDLMKGKSPSEMFGEWVNAGWAATTMSIDEFMSVFTKDVSRKVINQAISIDSRIWTSPELDGYLGDRVIVKKPVYHQGFNEIVIHDEFDKFLGVAHPLEVRYFTDQRGAKSTAKRVMRYHQSIEEADKATPDLDVSQEIIAIGEEAKEVIPNPPKAEISYTPYAPANSDRYTAPSPPSQLEDDGEDTSDKHELRAAMNAAAQGKRLANG